MKKKTRQWVLVALALSAIALTSCAKKPAAPNPADPYERFNRAMFKFNTMIDFVTIRPAAQIYAALTPGFVQKGVTNVFENIDEIPAFPNDFLQGNFKYMAVDFWRFVINTTFGVAGLFDVATHLGIAPHEETFGLTLAKWRGGKSSPFLILPLFGSSTVQNAIGNTADYYMTFWPYLGYNATFYIAHGVKFVNMRAQLLPADKLIGTSFDPYVFVRDAYIQKMDRQIADNQNLGKKTTN